MVAVHVIEPPAPVAVPVKVVFAAITGVVVEPATIGVTALMPLFIENAVVFAFVVQVRMEVPPELTLDGLAESVQTGAPGAGGGGGGGTAGSSGVEGGDGGVGVGAGVGVDGGGEVTVSVAVHVAEPPGPVAVPMMI